jgi:hypothetical protein
MSQTRSPTWRYGELKVPILRYLEDHGPTATPWIEHYFGVKHSAGRGIRKALAMHERRGLVRRTPKGGWLTLEKERTEQMNYDIWEITEEGRQWWAWRDWQSESAMFLREKSLIFGAPISPADTPHWLKGLPDEYFAPDPNNPFSDIAPKQAPQEERVTLRRSSEVKRN